MNKRDAEMVALGLLEPDIVQLENGELYWRDGPRRKRKPRKPSLFSTIKAARKAGVDKGTVTVGDVSVTFGEADPDVNSWTSAIAELEAKRRQH